jgi:hypothetical protein
MNLRLLRGLAGATTLALLATAMLSAPAMGANAREVYFGSPDGSGGKYENGDLVFGELTNTKVTTGIATGGKSFIEVLFRNDDGQTLNHTRIAGGDETTSPPLEYNPAFDMPDGNSLGGASIAVFELETDVAGASCEWDATGFLCDIGSLSPNDSATLKLVLNVPGTAGAHPYWFTASWNEGWSSTGTNADYNFAVGNLNVLEADCTTGTASWFLTGETLNLNDGDTSANACTGASASVRSGGNLTSDGHAQVKFDESAAVCPTELESDCFGRTVDVQILGGVSIPGGVIWTVQFVGTKSLTGIVHYDDDYDPDDDTTYDLIPLTKKFKCNTTTLTRNCWNSITPSAGKVKPVYVIVEFVTDGNGKGGGWI